MFLVLKCHLANMLSIASLIHLGAFHPSYKNLDINQTLQTRLAGTKFIDLPASIILYWPSPYALWGTFFGNDPEFHRIYCILSGIPEHPPVTRVTATNMRCMQVPLLAQVSWSGPASTLGALWMRMYQCFWITIYHSEISILSNGMTSGLSQRASIY